MKNKCFVEITYSDMGSISKCPDIRIALFFVDGRNRYVFCI